MSYKEMYEERRVDLGGEVELTDKVVFINRVSKVVKGGRRFGFTALVVSGDGAGHVGFALGKAGEVPAAIQKGSEKAHKRLVRIPLVGTTIPHNVIGRFGPTQVVLLPARPGTGVIAGSAVRAVVEAAGIKDIRTKVIGSNNPNNVLNATMEGLLRLKSPEDVSQVRGISLEEMGYAPF